MKTITKFQIISENLCYGPEPKENDEIEQRLTIRSDDRFWFSRYCYGEGFGKYILSEKKTGKLYNGRALRIFNLIECYCERNELVPRVTDCGSWEMTVFYSDGTKKHYSGSLIPEDDLLGKISQMIREEINDYELFAFDGATEDIYQQISPISIFESSISLHWPI